jgi:hypothetical protein
MKKQILLLIILLVSVVVQAQIHKTVNNLTPGNLITLLTPNELSTISSLMIVGSMDARDFKTMDMMPKLTAIDLNGVDIIEYYGVEGTASNMWDAYFANSIPQYAFNGNTSLTSVAFHGSITSIGQWAFSECINLISVNIPSSVISIGESAFIGCKSLTSVTISASVTTIGRVAFSNSSTHITVDPENPKYSSIEGVLFNKSQTVLICCPTFKSGNYTIPSSVKSVSDYGFNSCSSLTSLTIPNSITYFGESAFGDASSLTSIYSFPITPPATNLYDLYLFNGVDKTTCTLYVPAESLDLYKSATIWKDFLKIEAIITSATKNISNNRITLWPNPAKDMLTINADKGVASIYNAYGELEITQSLEVNKVLNISSLASGIYVVVVNRERFKIIKE